MRVATASPTWRRRNAPSSTSFSVTTRPADEESFFKSSTKSSSSLWGRGSDSRGTEQGGSQEGQVEEQGTSCCVPAPPWVSVEVVGAQEMVLCFGTLHRGVRQLRKGSPLPAIWGPGWPEMCVWWGEWLVAYRDILNFQGYS